MKMKRYTMIFFFVLTGCAGMNPMNRKEFVQWVNDKRFLTDLSSRTVDRPFGEVVTSVRLFRETCLNVQIHYSFQDSTSNSSGKTTLMTELKVIRPEKYAEFTYQLMPDPKPVNGIPERGMYYFAADIEAVGAKKTKITIYRFKPQTANLFEAFQGISKGEKVDCPDVRK
jgi:hypothetical protein